MKCFKCGQEIPDGWQFCGHCGIRASDPQSHTVMVEPTDADALLDRLRMVFAGEYEIEGELAHGGMGIVYRATEVALQRPVALKVLPPEVALTVRASERFKREAQMAAELEHPNIVPVYRVGQVGGIFHIAMKLVEGRSLDAIIAAQGALTVPATLYVLRAAARALAYAHDRQIVHRDIKGANILVDRDGRVMISDFGVALRASDASLTADGTMIGTPPFMSPEQCAGGRAGPQSDQYSLGIVGFQMLTGSVPFQAENVAGIMQHHFFTPAPDVRVVRDDVPPLLSAVLRRALAKDPADRFLTTGAMLAAIEGLPFSEADRQESESLLCRLAQGESVGRVTTRSLPALPDARTLSLKAAKARHRGWMTLPRAAGIGALALVGAGTAWWMRGADGAARPADAPPALVARPIVVVSSGGGAPSAATGKLRLLTTPANAEILIDGRRIGVGSALDVRLAAGTRRLSVRAQGYQTFDTAVIVNAGAVLSLGRVSLRAVPSP